MGIPEAREALRKIAKYAPDDIGAQITEVIDTEMYRRPPAKPIARARQEKITRSLVLSVLAAHRENPLLSNRANGRHHGIDGGRVSEILHGDRTPDFPEGTPEWRKQV